MRKTWSEDTLAHAIDEAFQEVFTLAQEMEEAFDGTPESLKQSSMGQSREAAATELETAWDTPSVPDALRENRIMWMEMSGKLFRPARRNNVVSCLQSCIAHLSSLVDDYDVKKLKESLQNSVDILSKVHFPGMSGR